MKIVTIHNLEECTAQEVFDYIALHLLVQNKQALGKEGIGCMYRTDNNLKCAAGILIPDEVYSSTMESLWWAYLVESNGFSQAHKDLILVFQSIHDNTQPVRWKEEITTLAKTNNLTFNPEKLMETTFVVFDKTSMQSAFTTNNPNVELTDTQDMMGKEDYEKLMGLPDKTDGQMHEEEWKKLETLFAEEV